MKRKRKGDLSGNPKRKKRKISEPEDDDDLETKVKKGVLAYSTKEFDRMSRIREAMLRSGGVVRIVRVRYTRGKSTRFAKVITKIVKEKIFELVSRCKREHGEVNVENLKKCI